MQRFRQSLSDIGGTWGLAILILAAGFVVAYQFIGPPPPKRIVLATGAEGGAYQGYGQQFADYLAAEGIQVDLRPTAGSVENLSLLDSGDVDLGFVQSGLSDAVATDNVVAIGSLYLEPLWFVLRSGVEIEEAGDLLGKRVSIGAEGSGTRPVVLNLLGAHGLDVQNSTLIDVPPNDLAAAFTTGEIDAAFIIAAPEAEQITKLANLDVASIRSLARADAYVRLFPYLSKINLPRGVLNLQGNYPEEDIHTVALTAMLAANEELHPALVDLLLLAATDIFGKHSLLVDAGQFPSPLYADLPLSKEAERNFKYGPPFLMRYLPFWAATLVGRLWVLLLPMIGLAVPLVKLVPPAYKWRIRRRLLRLYEELAEIDPLSNAIEEDEDLAARMQRLETLENQSLVEAVPKGYADDIYKLRRDIDLIRRRLSGAMNERRASSQ